MIILVIFCMILILILILRLISYSIQDECLCFCPCPTLLSHYVPCPGPKVLSAQQVARNDPCIMFMIRSSGVSAEVTSRFMTSANPIYLRHLPIVEYQTVKNM